VRLPMPDKASAVTEHFRLHIYAAARKRARGPRKNGPLTHTHVHPDAHALALILADSNPARLRILSSTSVLVINRPGPGPRRTP
jgi:hypothetical protein